jgi:hypothetical protein
VGRIFIDSTCQLRNNSQHIHQLIRSLAKKTAKTVKKHATLTIATLLGLAVSASGAIVKFTGADANSNRFSDTDN